MNDFEHTDHSGDTIVVRPFAGGDEFPGVAVEINDSGAVCVPAHKWPELCRAGYRSLGLLVPDLADIPNPAEVRALATDIARYFDSNLSHEACARRLLAAGWRTTCPAT